MEYIGKILNVNEYELKFGNKQQKIIAYACFKEKNDNTPLIVFSFVGDNKLYYANAHVKTNKIILMKTKQEKDDLILKFIDDYINDLNKDNYIIIPVIEKDYVEIISYNTLKENDVDLVKLQDLTIYKKEEKVVKTKVNKKFIIIFMIFFIILLAGCYVFINKEKLFPVLEKYSCIYNYKHDELNVDVEERRELSFTNKKLTLENLIVSYKFNDEEEYFYFKNNNLEFNYSPYGKGTCKYIDTSDTLRMFYDNYKNKELDFDKMSSVIEFYELKGYKCIKIVEENE